MLSLSALPSAHDVGGDHQHLFGITPMNSTRMYVLQSANDTERNEWIRACVIGGAFNIAQHRAPTKTQQTSLIEGYLDKSSPGRFLFDSKKLRHYFVLNGDKLAYWKTNQTGDIPLDECVVSTDSHVEAGAAHTNAFNFVPKKGVQKWILTADDHDTRMEWIKAIRS